MTKEIRNNIITAILVGAGDRGADTHGELALIHNDKIKFIGVAEPNDKRRMKFASKHSLDDKYVCQTWEELFSYGKIADVVFICTQDKFHTQPTLQALDLGYDIFLEKPMATTLKDCDLNVQKVKETGRFTDFYSKIKQYLKERKLGKIVNISMRENVSLFHYSHSFLRGNWHNTEQSSPMILAKCCHDLDLLYWFADSMPKKISSFGSQSKFGLTNAPGDVPDRCTDGCSFQENCFYYAPRLYIDFFPMYNGWPVSTITDNPESTEARLHALKTTDYGRCVYKVPDHDTVDQQVVIIEFDNKIIGTLTMHGFSAEEGRSIRIEGTLGELIGVFNHSNPTLTYKNSEVGISEDILHEIGSYGHGGGDEALFLDFIDKLRNRTEQESLNAQEALVSHFLAFKAEESRLNEVVLKI